MTKSPVSKKVSEIVESSALGFEIIKGLKFNYREIINRIYFYKNDRFTVCADDRAIFWNVVKPYIMHFAKNIDLDPKDFRAVGRGEANYYQTWVLNTRFQKWANDKNFSIKIDDLTQLVSEFGSYAWKLVKDNGENDIEPCDLRNLYFDPTVESIEDTDVVEKHYLTTQEIREKDGVWDNIEDLLKIGQDGNEVTSEFEKHEIWEFTGYMDDEGGKSKRMHVIGAGYGDLEVIAFEEELDEDGCVYFDFHLDKFSGRWLRVGAYETNFILQERANTLVNENASASAIASLLLLRSQDPNTRGNVLRGAITGQVITSSDLQQIPIDNRAAGMLLGELDRIEAQVRKNLMLPDVATGDPLPSGTTFRGQALASNAYKSAFKQMRNRISEPLKDVVEEYILPSLVKEWDKEEMIALTGSEHDIALYDDTIKAKRKIEFIANKNAAGVSIQPGELEALDAETEQSISRVGRKLKTGKKFFDFEYGFTIDPTGETYDKAQQNDALIQAITLTSQNPAISDIPAFTQLLENNGITSFKLKPEQKQAIAQINAPQLPMQRQDTLSSMVDTGNQS